VTLHDAVQAWILVTSMAAIWCVARTDSWHRWGYVFGLASEPGWFYAAWQSGQWGTLLLCAWWSWSWGVGAWRRFGRKQ